MNGYTVTVKSFECIENCEREQETQERDDEEGGVDEVDYVNKFHLFMIHTSCVVGPCSETLHIRTYNN